MYYAKALLFQLAAAATLMPAQGLNLRLLSAPDIEAVVAEPSSVGPVLLSIGNGAGSQQTSNPVRLDLGVISTSDRLRWGNSSEETPVGVRVQLKFELN